MSSLYPCSVALLAILYLSGCATMRSSSSGFLDDFEGLSETSEDGRSRTFYQENVDWAAISGVKVEAVTILLPEARRAKLTDAELEEFKSEARAIFREVFETRFTESDRYDEDTICVRIAITDLDSVNVKMNVVTSIIAVPVDNGGVSVEMEIVNAKTKERLYAFSGYATGSVTQVKGFFTKLGHAKSGLRKIAETCLDRVRPAPSESVLR